MSGPETPVADDDTWVLAGDVAQQLIIDIANQAKDRADEALDAKRIHGGMTLEEFLNQSGES